MSKTQAQTNDKPTQTAPDASPPADVCSIVADPRIGEIPERFRVLDDEGLAKNKRTTLPSLAECGKVLPIGYLDAEGKRHREFELIEWDWDVEEELGKLMEDNPEMPVNEYISEVICHCVVQLGSIDFTKLKRSQRRLIVHNMFMADVLFFYVWIRIDSQGKELSFDAFKCDHCRFEYPKYRGDLTTLEVQAFKDVPERTVLLQRGVSYGGQVRRECTVGPLKWAFMETADTGRLTNAAKFKRATIDNGLRAIKGAASPIVLTRDHLRSMDPKEINQLVAEIDQAGGGVVFEIRDDCHRCKKEFAVPIDWSYENFFARSSR